LNDKVKLIKLIIDLTISVPNMLFVRQNVIRHGFRFGFGKGERTGICFV